MIDCIDIDAHNMPASYYSDSSKFGDGLFKYFLPTVEKYMIRGAYFAFPSCLETLHQLLKYQTLLSNFTIKWASYRESNFVKSVDQYESDINL